MLEIWKAVVGYEGLYQVSSRGRAKSLPREVPARRNGVLTTRISPGRLLKPGLVTGQRWAVGLCREGKARTHLVAHLVAAAFLGPSHGLHVLHRNDVTTDDRLDNLYYGTHAQNMVDKVTNGRSHKGSTHHKAKLIEDQVRVLKQRLLTETDYKAMAVEYGVTVNTIQAIKHGTNWGWLK